MVALTVQVLQKKVVYHKTIQICCNLLIVPIYWLFQIEEFRTWHAPAMVDCSTVCPNCQHAFTCCRLKPCRINTCRSLHGLSGGSALTVLTVTPNHSPQISPSAPLAFVLPPTYPQKKTQPSPTDAKPEIELRTLRDTVRALRLSGWWVSFWFIKKYSIYIWASRFYRFLHLISASKPLDVFLEFPSACYFYFYKREVASFWIIARLLTYSQIIPIFLVTCFSKYIMWIIFSLGIDYISFRRSIAFIWTAFNLWLSHTLTKWPSIFKPSLLLFFTFL